MKHPPAVILSPHLDDAVLSCWHLLRGPGEVRVVNVFAGSPPPGSGVYWWDRITGATDSIRRMDERRMEDREAMTIAGRAATSLDFLDEQYEPQGQSVEEITAQICELIEPDAVVYAPAALGKSDDHERVRTTGLQLAERGHPVGLYADHPHAVQWGWPDWIDEPEHSPGVAEIWNQRLGEAGLDHPAPHVHRLDDVEHERKLRAVSAYRTQLPGLERVFGAIDGFPALPLEIVWMLP